MYVPRHFAETRVEVLHELIRRHPLGALVVATPEGPEASHVPFEIDPQPAPFGTLRCHVARANPLWQQIAADRPVLVVFQGEQGYVSPSWYAAKQEHGKVVPTWDYVAVHAYGAATVTHDAAWLRRMVEDLTQSPRARPRRSLAGERCARGLRRQAPRRDRRRGDPGDAAHRQVEALAESLGRRSAGRRRRARARRQRQRKPTSPR